VLVVVVAVDGVPTPVVHVVDVIPVWDRNMATSFTVNMVMMLVHHVAGWLAFVVVTVVLSMDVTVVHVVDVIPMRDCDVTTSLAVRMVMFEVLVVDCARHRFLTVCSGVRLVSNWRDCSVVPASLTAREITADHVAKARATGRLTVSGLPCLNCFDWRCEPRDAC
jgi:hypothetical protein